MAKKRVPCPLDPKHTVYAFELHRHLKKCNSKLPADLWISENVNRSGRKGPGDCKEEWPWVSRELACKVKKIWDDNRAEISDAFLQYASVENQLKREDLGALPRKHLTQQSSVLGHLDRLGLLKEAKNERTVFVEFGAGRAQLSSWLAGELSKENNRFVVVDRAGVRLKFENKVTCLKPEIKVDRLRCGIEHLNLVKVPAVADSTRVVALCKHICGIASDFSLRCVANARKNGANVAAVVFAPCCHNRTEECEFAGSEFLRSYEITADDFPALKVMASWATCGIKLAKRPTGNGPNQNILYSFTLEEKEDYGKLAKFALEYSRAEYLRSCGFSTKLYYYVPYELTPENILIVATV